MWMTIGTYLQFFLAGIVFWMVFGRMLSSGERQLFVPFVWIQAWWKKVTWDERLERSNDYGDILANLLGTSATIVVILLAILGMSFVAKLWIRFMFGG